jgi:purine-binding chemotaxis protein CheW
MGGKYLTFFLGKEEYGLPILVVREIIGMLAITIIPGSDPWLRGVINLRGKIIPVCDLRVKFGMTSIEATERSCIVVVQTHEAEMGIVVDQVSEVVDLAEDTVDAAPNLGGSVRTDYLLGIGTTGGKVRLLLDINRALSDSDVGKAKSLSIEPEDTK